MPSIVYEVPFIGASNQDRQFSQKGPTCWYYAAKMILKYHELLDPKLDAIYNSYKALSQLRKVLTAMGSEGVKQLQSGNKYHVDRMIIPLNQVNVSLYKEREAKNEKIQAMTQQVLEMSEARRAEWIKQQHAASQYVMATDPTLQTHMAAIVAMTGEVKKLENRMQHLNEAVMILSKRRKEVVYGCSLLTGFFEPNFFKAATIPGGKAQWQKTIDELYTVLANHGPVYAVGEILVIGTDRTSFGFSDYSDINVTQFKPKAGHAVVVVGADTSKELVYYVDPNYSNRILKVKFNIFSASLQGTCLGGQPSLYATVNCKKLDHHGTEYCMHTRASKLAYRRWERLHPEIEFGDFMGADPPPDKPMLMLTYQ